MKVLSLTQGSPEWLAHRASHFNASDAPAMMGVSPYKTRNQLLRELATGFIPEIDSGTQQRFDDGHRYEALSRPVAEEIIGEDLSPVTGVDGQYSASFDGLTLMEDVAFEHKSINDEIRECVCAGDLPAMYRIQMEHQLMVSGASKCLFMGSKWDAENKLIEEKHFWYEPDLELRTRIVKGWEQFAADLAAYVPPEVLPAATATPISDLPALQVDIVGQVAASNFPQWRTIVTERIASINTDLQTDQDFADADKMVKFLDDGEKRIDLVKTQAQSQAKSIDEVFRALDEIKASMRAKRLELDKLVKARKDSIRVEILQGGKAKLAEHIASLNKRLGKNYMPTIEADFAGVMKSKRTISSLRDAVDTELARAKIDANEIADKIGLNLNTLRDLASEHTFLFADTAAIVLKNTDDLVMLIESRINKHKEDEAKRLDAERARIRVEEEAKATAKAKAEADAQAAADIKAQAAEQQAKAASSAKPAEPLPVATGQTLSLSAFTTGMAPAPRDGALILREQIIARINLMSEGELRRVLDSLDLMEIL